LDWFSRIAELGAAFGLYFTLNKSIGYNTSIGWAVGQFGGGAIVG
jgi:hypothetical protein